MNDTVPSRTTKVLPLRTWIPWIFLLAMPVARWIPSLIQDGPAQVWMFSAFGPALLSLAILLWWLTYSRANWKERVFGTVLLVIGFIASVAMLDSTMLGPPIIVMTIPMGAAAATLVVLLLSNLGTMRRTWIAALAGFVGFACSGFFRNEGFWGNFAADLKWRWTANSEAILAERQAKVSPEGSREASEVSEMQAAFQDPAWPGFRGPDRDGIQRHGVFASNWQGASAPTELWRIPVGPAWSSFAVAGKFLVTQEQRGENEVVVCYDADSGKQIWERGVKSRFFEALGGLGPRGTPTIEGGSIYSLGAEGWILRLDAASGTVIWQADLRELAKRTPPMWGFSSSPHVADGLVVVHAGGKNDLGVLALSCETGELQWSAPAGEMSYGSIQKLVIQGHDCLGLLSDQGLHLYRASDGTGLLHYEWIHQGYRSLQPVVFGENRVLLPTGVGSGTRCIEVDCASEPWQAKEKWTTRNLKPDFNDLVIFDGYAYGFDNAILTCIRLADGERMWKGGRYGKGQLMLLAESQQILVLGEQGELAMIRATPEGFAEVDRIQALEGRTWNHPVVVGDRLFLRNASEAVAYRLSSSSSEVATSELRSASN